MSGTGSSHAGSRRISQSGACTPPSRTRIPTTSAIPTRPRSPTSTSSRHAEVPFPSGRSRLPRWMGRCCDQEKLHLVAVNRRAGYKVDSPIMHTEAPGDLLRCVNNQFDIVCSGVDRKNSVGGKAPNSAVFAHSDAVINWSGEGQFLPACYFICLGIECKQRVTSNAVHAVVGRSDQVCDAFLTCDWHDFELFSVGFRVPDEEPCFLFRRMAAASRLRRGSAHNTIVPSGEGNNALILNDIGVQLHDAALHIPLCKRGLDLSIARQCTDIDNAVWSVDHRLRTPCWIRAWEVHQSRIAGASRQLKWNFRRIGHQWS